MRRAQTPVFRYVFPPDQRSKEINSLKLQNLLFYFRTDDCIKFRFLKVLKQNVGGSLFNPVSTSQQSHSIF